MNLMYILDSNSNPNSEAYVSLTLMQSEERQRGLIKWGIIWHYFRAGGIVWFFLFQVRLTFLRTMFKNKVSVFFFIIST